MAVSYIGQRGSVSTDNNAQYTNGGAPVAFPAHSSSQTGDLMVWIVHIRGTGGNEDAAFPAGWTEIFAGSSTSGSLFVATRVRQGGDGNFTLGTLTNVTSGTSGETVTTTILTFRGQHDTTPIAAISAALSTWASSTTLGSVAAPSPATVIDGAMAVVVMFREENVTSAGNPTPTDNLTWNNASDSGNVFFNTSLGLDSGGIIAYGLNATGSSQTLTSKSATSGGTAQVGCGIAFIIDPAPAADVFLGQACL